MRLRRRFVIMILVLLVLVLAGWFLFFRSITVTREVEVPYSLWRTGEQINNLPAISRWFSPFTTEPGGPLIAQTDKNRLVSGDTRLYLKEKGVFSSRIELSKGKETLPLFFQVVSDSTQARVSRVQLIYRTTSGNQWFGGQSLASLAETNLENLRDYMTDTRRFYGFEIQEVKVEDTAFLFSRVTVPLADKRKGILQLFDKLTRFATEKNAGYNGTRIFYSMQSGKDITLFAGIGVTQAVTSDPSTGIEYKRMPFGRNLLVTTYQGPFGESRKAFEALELFKSDHQLSSMAIPFQKFLSDGYDFTDDQVVQLKVYYPVF